MTPLPMSLITILALCATSQVAFSIIHLPVQLNTLGPSIDHEQVNNTLSSFQTYSKFSYSVNAQIGSPPTDYSLVLDTLSPWTWTSSATGNSDYEASKTYVANGSHSLSQNPYYEITCETSALDMFGVTDIGNGGVTVVTPDFLFCPNTNFSLGWNTMDSKHYPFSDDTSLLEGGVLGLGHVNGSDFPGDSTLLDRLRANDQVQSRVLALDAPKDGVNPGIFTLGGLDPTRFTGSLTLTNTTSNQSNVYTDGIYVHTQLLGLSFASNGSEVSQTFNDVDYISTRLDSTLSGIALSEPMYSWVIDSFGAQPPDMKQMNTDPNQHNAISNWANISCAGIGSSAYTLNIGFRGINIAIPATDLIVSKGGHECQLAVALDPNAERGVLGVPFFRNAYVVWDWDNKNIWVGASGNCAPSSMVDVGAQAVSNIPEGGISGTCTPRPAAGVQRRKSVVRGGARGNGQAGKHRHAHRAYRTLKDGQTSGGKLRDIVGAVFIPAKMRNKRID